jgi:hypothetical protein
VTFTGGRVFIVLGSTIPLTNNATERLIRHFDPHSQNLAGFDSLEAGRFAPCSSAGAQRRAGGGYPKVKTVKFESVSCWGQVPPVNTSDSEARVCKTRRFDLSERK